MRCIYHTVLPVRIACSIFGIENIRMLLLVQFYNVIAKDSLACDIVDDKMEFICLSWIGMEIEKGDLCLGKYFNCDLLIRYMVWYILSIVTAWWASSTRQYSIRRVEKKLFVMIVLGVDSGSMSTGFSGTKRASSLSMTSINKLRYIY